jgi:hypothetical protein
MSSSRKWPEIEQTYLKSTTANINLKLINVMSHRKSVENNFSEGQSCGINNELLHKTLQKLLFCLVLQSQ